MSATATHHIARELDSRVSDGIEVRLLWHPLDDRVSVAVNDSKTGDAFAIDVAPGQHPMDVFHHPYAYAAASSTSTAA